MDFSKNDAIRNIMIGTIAAIPDVGGIVSYILDKELPQQIEIEYREFVKKFEQDLRVLDKEINWNYVETPQFYSMFTKVINEVISDYMKEKTIFYENILINTLDEKKSDKKEFFFVLTKEFSKDEIMYLYLIYSKNIRGQAGDKALNVRNMISVHPEQHNYLLGMVGKLVRYKLMIAQNLTTLGMEYCKFVFSPIESIIPGT